MLIRTLILHPGTYNSDWQQQKWTTGR